MSKPPHAVCFLIFIIAFYFFPSSNIYAEPAKERPSKKKNDGSKKKTKVAFTYYFDDRDYNTLNIVTSTTDLPENLKIWGFIDIHGDQSNDKERSDLTRYFLEYRLSRPLFPNDNSALKRLGFEVEYNDFNGAANDVLRFGLTYKHPVPFLTGSKSWLQWRYHPYETDGTGSQVSVIYFLSLSKRVFISGFADLNLEDEKDDRWVIEPQINFIFNRTVDLVLEVRFNEFEDNNNTLGAVLDN